MGLSFMQSVILGSENHENETLLPFITICPETAFCHSWSLVSRVSLLCRPTLAGLGPPRTVCLLSLAIRLPIIFH